MKSTPSCVLRVFIHRNNDPLSRANFVRRANRFTLEENLTRKRFASNQQHNDRFMQPTTQHAAWHSTLTKTTTFTAVLARFDVQSVLTFTKNVNAKVGNPSLSLREISFFVFNTQKSASKRNTFPSWATFRHAQRVERQKHACHVQRLDQLANVVALTRITTKLRHVNAKFSQTDFNRMKSSNHPRVDHLVVFVDPRTQKIFVVPVATREDISNDETIQKKFRFFLRHSIFRALPTRQSTNILRRLWRVQG